MFQVNHFGLYFTSAARDGLQAAQGEEYITHAWDALHTKFADSQTSALDRVLAGVLIEKLGGDQAGNGDQILDSFQSAINIALPENVLDAAGDLQTRLHTLELLRDHHALSSEAWQRCANDLAEQVDYLITRSASTEYAALLWLSTVKLLAGIVFEREQWFEEATSAFKQVIDKELRPQGFIQPAVEPDRFSPYTALERQVLATKALVLMAEAASASTDLDLWSYKARGVSTMTAAIYPIYYFYTTHKWKWDEDLPPETVQNIFRQHGGWLEMVQQRLQHKDIALLLADLRPLWDRSGGGMTTLTHGWLVKSKRRSLFG